MSASASFGTLTRAGQSRRLRLLAQRALAAYPVRPARVSRLATGWNATFRVDAVDGSRYALRVHRTTGPDAAMVRTELAWLAALRRDTPLRVPEPVPTVDGAPLVIVEHPAVPGARTCDLLRWVPGRFIERGLTPSHLEAVGRLMGRLQNHGRGFDVPGFTRPRPDDVTRFAAAYDDGLCPEVVSSCRELVSLADPDGAPIVTRVLDTVRQARDVVGAENRTLIHADLHYENVLFTKPAVGSDPARAVPDGAGAIDFDDCGRAPAVYDLAVTLSELQHRADYRPLRAALLAGYRRECELPHAHEGVIDAYIALRFTQLMMEPIWDRDNPRWRDIWVRETVGILGLLDRLVPA